jgi:autotransporter-associated beta strand protein
MLNAMALPRLLVVALLLATGSARAEDWSPLWSTATLSQGRFNIAAAAVGSKIFFGGGYMGSADSSVVDIYDTSTGAWSTAHLSQARDCLAATAAGGKVFFGGGRNASGSSSRVDIYDTSTGSWTTANLSQARWGLVAASAGNKVVFGGGFGSSTVDIYDLVTNTWSNTQLSEPRYQLAAASAGSKIFFGGGYLLGSKDSNVVDIYDAAANSWSTTTLAGPRSLLASTSLGNKIYFGGGLTDRHYDNAVDTGLVDIFDTAANSHSIASLSRPRYGLSAASIGSKVLFAGGNQRYLTSALVDIYDAATDSWSTAQLSETRSGLVAASAGNKALFAGGTGASNVVDIYTLQEYGTIASTKSWTLVDRTTVAGRMALGGGSLNLGSYPLTVGSLAGSAPIHLGVQALTVGGDNTSSTYSGSIVGNGTLVKTGDAALTLTGNNSYSGPTTVNGGSLLVNGLGSLASPVTVHAGATFGGDGRAGSVTVKGEGHVAPGASASALRLSGDLILEADAKLDFKLGPPAFSDLIAMDSATTLSLNGQQFSDFTFTAYTGFGPGDYTLIDAFAIEGALGTNRNGTIAGLPASLAVSGNDLMLTVVPEPSTFALLGIGAIGLLACACRRQWQAARAPREPSCRHEQ